MKRKLFHSSRQWDFQISGNTLNDTKMSHDSMTGNSNIYNVLSAFFHSVFEGTIGKLFIPGKPQKIAFYGGMRWRHNQFSKLKQRNNPS